MRSKTDFYRLFFEQLARRGFDVKRSQSSDYIADIYFKNQLVAYFSKADTVIQNPFVTVKDNLIRLINDTAQDTANKAGICRDCPYTDANEKLPNGSYKLAEYPTSRSLAMEPTGGCWSGSPAEQRRGSSLPKTFTAPITSGCIFRRFGSRTGATQSILM